MDKDTTQISEPIAKLLEGRNIAFVATLMKDGWPQITPTWVDLEDGKILVNTAEGRLKQKNISRDDRVAISVIDQNNPYHMVTVRGRVVEQRKEGSDEHVDKLAKKYLGVDRYPRRSPNEKRIIIKIKPERVYYQPPPN
ncbi:MAG TPA: PPOX class F420-dependent oxidoreductase [Methylomirabilota bacterium]|nr:PPOX class F420-dependent oxidoreductase [Methylomirabilota bacterium]